MKKLIIAICLTLTACANSPLKFTQDTTTPPASTRPEELKDVSIRFSPESNQNSTFVPAPEFQSAIANEWKAELERSLAQGHYFASESKTQVDLKVTVNKLTYTDTGSRADLDATYEFVDRKANATILKINVGTKDIDSSLKIDNRRIVVTNKVVKENIKIFLQRLREQIQ